jgi:hypothetical protein
MDNQGIQSPNGDSTDGTPEWFWDVLNGLQRVVKQGAVLPKLPRDEDVYVVRMARPGGWDATAILNTPVAWLAGAINGQPQRVAPAERLPSLPDDSWVYSVVVEKLPAVQP